MATRNITRYKPYSLVGDPTAEMVEQINEMFALLFQDAELVETRDLLSATLTDVNAGSPSRGSIILGSGDSTSKWEVLELGANNSVLTSDGTDASWDTSPAVVSLIVDPDNSTGEFTLAGRASLGFAVPYVQPTSNNENIAFDVFPKGSPGDFAAHLGVAWMDVCSTDIVADSINYECLRMGKLANGMAHVGAANGGSGTVRNLHLQILGGNVAINSTVAPAWRLVVNGTSVPAIALTDTDVERFYIGLATAANNWFTGTADGDHAIRGAGGDIHIGSNSATPVAAIIVKAGAAGLVNIRTDAGLGILDTNASHYMRLDCGSDLTADRQLSFVPGDAARTITLTGNPTLADWFDQAVKTTSSPTFAALTLTAPLTVANGGTGRATSTTAYAVLCAGTTATGAHQSTASAGTSGQVLTSNGASALPSFQAAPASAPTEETTTSTGTVNNHDLNARYTYLRCNNATALTLTGFTVLGSAPTGGDIVIIDNVGSSTVKVTNQDSGSTAANRIITPSANGQIIGANGRMIAVYDTTTDRWRCDVIAAGSAISVAHGDCTFVSGSGTWTVSSTGFVLSYVQQGNLVFYNVFVAISSTSIATSYLGIRVSSLLPGGFSLGAGEQINPVRVKDNSTFEIGYAQGSDAGAGVYSLDFLRISGNFAISTDNTGVKGGIWLTVA